MGKYYKYELQMESISEVTTLETHFTNMAKKGWMIDTHHMFTRRYRAIEPQEACFFVDVPPDASVFDYPENDRIKAYRTSREAMGWTYVTASKEYHVFVKEELDPLHTNDKPHSDDSCHGNVDSHTNITRYADVYLAACRRTDIRYYVAFTILFAYLFIINIGRGADVFLSNLSFFYVVGSAFFLVQHLWMFSFVLLWYLRTWWADRRNQPMPAVSYRLSRLRMAISKLCMAVLLSGFFATVALDIVVGHSWAYVSLRLLPPIAIIGTSLWIMRQINTNPRHRGENRLMYYGTSLIVIFAAVVLTIAVHSRVHNRQASDYIGTRPTLTLETLGAISQEQGNPDDTYFYHSISTRISGSAIVPINYRHNEHISAGMISTTIQRSVSRRVTALLFDHILAQEQEWQRLTRREYILVQLHGDTAAFWGADRGVALDEGDGAINIILQRDRTLIRVYINIGDVCIDVVGEAVRALWYAI